MIKHSLNDKKTAVMIKTTLLKTKSSFIMIKTDRRLGAF